MISLGSDKYIKTISFEKWSARLKTYGVMCWERWFNEHTEEELWDILALYGGIRACYEFRKEIQNVK